MITHEIKDYIQLDGFRDILLKYMIVPWDQSMVEGEVSGFCWGNKKKWISLQK